MRNNKKFKLTTLTPIHVGNGTNLIEGIDYSTSNDKTELYFHPHYFLLGGEKHISNFIDEKGNVYLNVIKQEYQKKAKITQLQSYKRLSLSRHINSDIQIKAHIRTNNELYIPGTSIKGAIKSAYLNYYSSTVRGQSLLNSPAMVDYLNKNIVKDRHNQFAEHLFVGNPSPLNNNHSLEVSNLDPFRFVRVTDFHSMEIFMESQILATKVLTGYGDKERGLHFNDYLINLEIVPSNTTMYGILDFDLKRFNHYLQNLNELSDDSGLIKTELSNVITSHSELTFESFIQWSRKYTLNWINSEINKLDEFSIENNDSTRIDILYDNLIDLEERIKKAKNAIPLRLGMGTGFNIMTGNWHSTSFFSAGSWKNEFLRVVRKKDDYFKELPRSRKIGVPSKEESTSFLGFIMLEPVDTGD